LRETAKRQKRAFTHDFLRTENIKSHQISGEGGKTPCEVDLHSARGRKKAPPIHGEEGERRTGLPLPRTCFFRILPTKEAEFAEIRKKREEISVGGAAMSNPP